MIDVKNLGCEATVHRHAPSERAELFHSLNGGSAEAEVLVFLHALVFLFKPAQLLETGTGEGHATLAIARAVRANGFGHLYSVDIDPACTRSARSLLCEADADLHLSVELTTVASLEFIESWTGEPFEFVFFDSLLEFRHIEFEALRRRGMLSPRAVCVFHDTSRLRGETMHDYNPEMIAALDEASQGNQWLESDLSRGLRVLKLG